MRPADFFLYLVGHRGAIERIAASKGAVWIGALLVLTAGIARNYDHLDLLREPEWFLAPFGVSLLSALIVFLCVDSRLDLYRPKHKERSFRSFLALFWMTAPCAWLYALPAEVFTDLVTATKINVALLAIVSLWRVFLITRAVQVLTGGKGWAILLAVLTPACAEAWLGSIFGGRSLVSIMGGVRLPPHHEILQAASSTVMTTSFLLGLALAPFFLFLPRRLTESPRGIPKPTERAKGSAWTATLVLGLAWVAVALPLQLKMQHRYRLQSFLNEDRIPEGIDYAAAQGPDGFASWQYLPPDPFGRGFAYAELFEAMDGTEPAWLRTLWLEQSLENLKLFLNGSSERYETFLESYKEVPGGMDFLLAHQAQLRASIRPGPYRRDVVEETREAFDEAMAKLKADAGTR